MIDYSKLREHELKMMTNLDGYMKFAKAFFDSQLGITSPFTEKEFHQAIEYQKELVKRNIEESCFSKEVKDQKKREIDISYSSIEEYLKKYYFVRIQ
jgi:trans-2-enoyl-CoA reductase